MPGCGPSHGLWLWFPLWLCDGWSGLGLGDGTDVGLWLVPGACLWLGLPWLSLGFSLALTVCGSCALFFVSSWCVGLIRLFLCYGTLQWLGASMHAWRFGALEAAAESGEVV